MSPRRVVALVLVALPGCIEEARPAGGPSDERAVAREAELAARRVQAAAASYELALLRAHLVAPGGDLSRDLERVAVDVDAALEATERAARVASPAIGRAGDEDPRVTRARLEARAGALRRLRETLALLAKAARRSQPRCAPPGEALAPWEEGRGRPR